MAAITEHAAASSAPADDAATLSIAFIGAGNMAAAIIKGLLANKVVSPAFIRASSPSGPSSELRDLGIITCRSNAECVDGANVIILAVKPFILSAAIASCRDKISPTATIISIAAGTSIAQIQSELASERPYHVVRVMPNTPCAIGEGVSAYCLGPNADARDGAIVRRIFESVGEVHEVKESHMDAVTGVSGSGPAYVFMFLEALADGGVASGLPRATAMALALQMVKGAAALAQETKKHPGELKDSVASPGGTTIAAIQSLESSGFRGAVINAVVAATKRSIELRGGDAKPAASGGGGASGGR